MKHLIPLLLLSACCSISLSAAVPLRWTVETSRAKPETFDEFAGATYDLEATLLSYGKPLEVVGEPHLYWQTNGMGSAYWPAPATVSGNVLRATWTPACDVGARAYNCFIGITGTVYNAAFQLRLLPSPGAVPNVIDKPPRVLDLANTVVVNPPWPTDATIDSSIRRVIHEDGITAPVETNVVSSIISNTVTKTFVEDLGISGGGGSSIDTNAVRDIALTPATNYTDRATGEVVRLVGALADEKRDLTNLVVYAEKYITVTWNDPTLDPPISEYDTFYGGGPYWIETRDQYESFSPQEDQFEGPGWYVNDFGFYSRQSSDHGATSITDYISGPEGTTRFTWTAKDRTIVGVEPTTNTLATTSDLAGKADSSELAPLSIGYQRLYSFQTSATNVNISVTNYPPTAEEAEGRTHFDPTAPDPDLDFSTVPASLRVDETRGGKRTVVDTRDWPFWFFTSKLPGILAAAREYAREAYTNALVSLAAWASRTATGAENPAGDSTLVVDVPNIWLMTDQTFEKHVAGSNSCWVIRSKNAAVSPGVATNGFLELTDAFGAPYIRFNKTEATFADPPADGISYDADAGEWLISYSTEAQPRGGANAALQGSADYPGKAILKEADDPLCPAVITWSGSARNWVMHARPKQIDGIDPDRMFFGAVVEIEGQDYIEYLKPVSFSHIVLPNGKKIAPDVPQSATVGSTVTWKVVL